MDWVAGGRRWGGEREGEGCSLSFSGSQFIDRRICFHNNPVNT